MNLPQKIEQDNVCLQHLKLLQVGVIKFDEQKMVRRLLTVKHSDFP